jgi:MFS family permease
LQAGNAVSFFGYGLILPFEIIYLHQIRGFATATAGLVLAAILGTATLVTPPSGALLDHFRPKPILIAGNLTSALGYAGFAFVDRPWEAFACAVVGGAGAGAARTANQTLLITLVRPEQRAASSSRRHSTCDRFKRSTWSTRSATSRSRWSYWRWCRIDAPRRRTRAPWDEDSGRSPAIAGS